MCLYPLYLDIVYYLPLLKKLFLRKLHFHFLSITRRIGGHEKKTFVDDDQGRERWNDENVGKNEKKHHSKKAKS